MILKIEDVPELLARARAAPADAFPEIRKLAAADHWATREVAATLLVRIGEKHPSLLVKNALAWARDPDPNVRRAASEGLRGLVKKAPESVWPVIERLRRDADPYVKKSVASVLRNASGKHPEAVEALCARWAKEKHPDTDWIVKNGLRKLR